MNAIHTNINIIFGTEREKTKRFMDILAPEGYVLSMTQGNDYYDSSDGVKMVILCMTEYSVIEKIRRVSDVPIMYVAKSADEFTTIMALSKGADSVVAEDVPALEFAARVKAVLRRSSAARNAKIAAAETAANRALISEGEILLDRNSREVTRNGVKIPMTKIEFGILEYLMSNRGNICSVENIYSCVWKCSSYDVRKTVVEHIRRLRAKIETDPKHPRYIRVIFGSGYVFEDSSSLKTAI